MRIAEVAPLYARVPPDQYGGTERVVHWLTETLVERGHDVTLFATADAQTSARLHVMRNEPLFDTWNRRPWRAELAHATAVAEALRDADRFDVIHFQLGGFSVPFSVATRVPTVHSFGSYLHRDDEWLIRRYAKAQVTVRSRRQMDRLPLRRQRTMSVIHNGCDFDIYKEPSAKPGKYLVYLGRMGAIKNPAGAIRIAREAGMPIILAGDVVEEGDQEYFDARVRPLIDGRDVQWVGEVDDRGKQELFRQAAALLFPIQHEEAFGIVMIEAMACGVPVIACGYGSVPEVIEPGVTGFFDEDEHALAAFVPRALALNRRAVRAAARRRFSRQVMTDGYLRVFEAACGI